MNSARIATALRLLADAIEDDVPEIDVEGPLFTPRQARARELMGLPDRATSGTSFGSVVYFIQGIDGGPIKIGTARELVLRVEAIQSCCPMRLRVLRVVPGGEDRERLFHDQFAGARLHGKWFSPTLDLLRFIGDLDGSA